MNDPRWRERPHRRYNALSGEWVLVSPERAQRPWQGEVTSLERPRQPAYDPACHLCPGNERAGGRRNPRYESTYCFDNDFPALLADVSEASLDDRGLLVAASERGRCRVVAFTPRHDLSISHMTTADVRRVIDTWADEYALLGSDPSIASVLVFENRGAAMGASSAHPHSQIWACETLPNEVLKERATALAYRSSHGGACLLCAYVERELELDERIVYANDHAVVLVPFWAVWPYEAAIVTRRHAGSLGSLRPSERDAYAAAMRQLTAAYDRIFDVPFPYSMGFHQASTDGAPHDDCHLHAHYLPPLLRAGGVRKYMVGFELLGMPQRDTTAEAAAARLRELCRADA